MSKIALFFALLLGLLIQIPARAQAGKPGSLDYDYFKAKVQPIFVAKRTGRARCISCHVTPTGAVFQLQKLAPGETSWNEEQTRKNFEAVTQVVALPGNPKSPLLIHPLAEDAGGDFFHSGGKQFPSQNDPEWKTMKAWIMGETGSKTQARN
jgi:hypothetical protein